MPPSWRRIDSRHCLVSVGQVIDVVFQCCRTQNIASEKQPWVDNYGRNITVHGFRSTMRDYLAEQTDIDHATAEICLAHTVGSAVERSYRRGDLLEKRRVAMQIWGNFTESHES